MIKAAVFLALVAAAYGQLVARQFAAGPAIAHAVGHHAAPVAYAQQAFAHPAYAQQAYAHPAYAQQAFAHPAYAQQAYAQPAYVQHTYAAPAVVKAPVVAKAVAPEPYDPNPQYSYSYQIADAVTGDSKSASETRDGDVVKGQYSLVEPDGSIRTVTYTADPINGFNAVVDRTAGHVKVAAPAVVKAPIAHAPAFAVRQPVFAQHHAQPVFAAQPAPAVFAQAAPAVVRAPVAFRQPVFAQAPIAHAPSFAVRQPVFAQHHAQPVFAAQHAPAVFAQAAPAVVRAPVAVAGPFQQYHQQVYAQPQLAVAHHAAPVAVKAPAFATSFQGPRFSYAY